MIDIAKPSHRRRVLVVVILIVSCYAAAWLIAQEQVWFALLLGTLGSLLILIAGALEFRVETS